jgi:hypothetical protein
VAKKSKRPSSISDRFFPKPIIYASLLPLVAGAASPTAGHLHLTTPHTGEESTMARYFSFSGSLHLQFVAVVASEGGADWTSSSIKRLWSWKAILLNITSAAGHCCPTSKASTKPIYMLVKESGKVSTSSERPPSRLATASNADA